VQEDGRLVPVLLQPRSEVLWCPVTPGARAGDSLFFDASLPPPLRVDVEAGDVLYLPSMWCVVWRTAGGSSWWC
jgi:hypothetical protein